jgi:Zn finger protein HypA/HybF involved in hydrogenase expression
MSQTVVEDKAEQKEIEKRGKPLTCRYCKKTFKIENIAEKNAWQANDFICPLCGEKFCILPPLGQKEN